MTLTVEQRLQMLIGAYTFQITAAQAENEQLKAENEQLKARLAEKDIARDLDA